MPKLGVEGSRSSPPRRLDSWKCSSSWAPCTGRATAHRLPRDSDSYSRSIAPISKNTSPLSCPWLETSSAGRSVSPWKPWFSATWEPSPIAAYNIADTAIKLVIVAFMGTTSANAIIVGKRIGEGDMPGAMRTADFCASIAPLMGAAMGLALVGFSFVVPLLFNVTPAVRALARIGMIIFGCCMPIRITNWHLIVGVLRAGGDTRFSMILDVGGTWLVSLPLVILAGLVFHAPFWVVYACTLTEDLPKLFVGIPRLRSRKWLEVISPKGLRWDGHSADRLRTESGGVGLHEREMNGDHGTVHCRARH